MILLLWSYAPISSKGHDDDDNYSFTVTPCGTDFLYTASGFGKVFSDQHINPLAQNLVFLVSVATLKHLAACKKRLWYPVRECNDTIGV